MTPAGKRDRRIKIETPTETTSASGAVTVGDPWLTFAQAWAMMNETGGSEIWSAQRVNPEVNSVWTINWIKGVTSKMRIRWDDPEERRARFFGIQSVTGSKRENQLILACIEDIDG